MIRKDKETWMVLCEQAAAETDPQRLVELVTEIEELLERKQKRLNAERELVRQQNNTAEPVA